VLFGGLLVVMLKMTNIAMSRQVRYGESPDFFGMLNNGDFAIAMSGVLFSSWG